MLNIWFIDEICQKLHSFIRGEYIEDVIACDSWEFISHSHEKNSMFSNHSIFNQIIGWKQKLIYRSTDKSTFSPRFLLFNKIISLLMRVMKNIAIVFPFIIFHDVEEIQRSQHAFDKKHAVKILSIEVRQACRY